MAVRDREWPGFTIWYCCQECGRLWPYQEAGVVALDLYSSGPGHCRGRRLRTSVCNL